jgi:hypothetical protein
VTSGDPSTDADDSPDNAFHGHATRRIVSEHLWLDVLAAAGPRIVRLGLTGSTRNLLAETPDIGWETPFGRYELLGGHRLWFAPEDPDRVAIPDGCGLTLEDAVDGLRLTGAPEAPTGLVRSMTLRLLPSGASLELHHELRNAGTEPIELAPWAITQLPLGGTVLVPQPPATEGHEVSPNRTLVLWPYTSWEDARFRPLDGVLTLDALAGPSLKLGTFIAAGWVGYVCDGVLLVRHFDPQPGEHPDRGCNVEVFVGDRYLELEVLGPLAELAPGASVALVERWEIQPADSVLDMTAQRELARGIDGRDRPSVTMTQ